MLEKHRWNIRMKASLFIVLQVQVYRRSWEHLLKQLSFCFWNKLESLVAWNTKSPLRLSAGGQVSVVSRQVSDISCMQFIFVQTGVEVSHPDVEEGEEEDDHQDADHGAVHFPKLPSRSKVLIRLLLLDLELLQSGAWHCCSPDILLWSEDTLEPIWTTLWLEAGAGRLNVELIWPCQAGHPSPILSSCLSSATCWHGPAFFPREQSWTEAVSVLLHFTLLSL